MRVGTSVNVGVAQVCDVLINSSDFGLSSVHV